MSYTKGEWRIEGVKGGAPIVVSDTCWRKQKREIAKVLYSFGSEDPEVYSNAHLISAAPDLLEACKVAVGFCVDFRQTQDWENHPDVGILFAVLKRAIAKTEPYITEAGKPE